MVEQLTADCIRIDYTPRINYATVVCGDKCINNVQLQNNDDSDWHDVTVAIEGEFLTPAESRLDLIQQGQTVEVGGLNILPDIEKLRTITEGTDTLFSLSVKIGDKEVYQHDYPVLLMAFDQWPGINYKPELLTTFVTPNASCLAQVRLNTARILEQLTGSSALNDYQTKDPNRVRKMMAAVYEALHDEGIVYIAPPASFENTGQRIRMADQLLSQKQGTCADLSILMASCLESIGLHPMLFVIKGHMFVGCWLEEKHYPHQFCDDVSFISKSIADGVSEIAVVEATMLTQRNATFEMAVKAAEDHIHLTPNDFIQAVDVNTCRHFGIRPLPTTNEEAQALIGADNGSASGEVKEVRHYDIQQEGGRQVTRQQIWERKLLDFSLRNNLLNMRLGKNLIPFVSYDINQLEDKLQEKTDFKIQPIPIEGGVSPDTDGIYHSQAYRDKLSEIVLKGMKGGVVYSYLKESELATALKGLFRASRTALEENGANTLFLVFGLLKWYETDVSIKPRYAPLILVPVDIVRRSGNNYVLRLREEETTFNTTLIEMMKQQYETDLSSVVPLPLDESGIDVCKVFAIVRSIIKDKARWDVIEENVLSLYSFSKFVMWNDIHNNADKLRENPVVASLLQNRLVDISTESNINVRNLDRTQPPGECAIPVDVDSSQLEAVIESGEGRSFILHGPPGTGKSQTITNMISNALFHGRRVLFVAEKMAALEVVQKRLAKIGLDPFCLEMHSNKMTKSHLLQQLQSALDLTRIKSPQDYKEESKALFEQRKQLIGYVDILHKQQPTGLSLYDYISRYISFDTEDAITPAPEFISGIDGPRIQDSIAAVEELGAVFRLTGLPDKSKLFGLFVHDTNDIEARTNTFLHRLSELLPKAIDTMRQLSRANGICIPETQAGCQWATQMATAVASASHVNAAIAAVAADPSLRQEWLRHIDTGERQKALYEALAKHYQPEILDIDLVGLRRDWAEANNKWFIPKYFAKKNVLKMLRGYRSDISYDDISPLIQQLEDIKKLSAELSKHRDDSERVFGVFGAKGREQWGKMKECLSQVAAIQQLFADGGISVDFGQLSPSATRAIDPTPLRQLSDYLRDSAAFCSVSSKLTLEELAEKTNVWLMNIGQVRNWSQWCIRRKALLGKRQKPVVDYIEAGHSSQEASEAMQRGLYKKLAMDVIDGNEQLRAFNGLIFEDVIEKYRTLAKDFQNLTKRALYCQLASSIPSQTIEAASNSEMGILKRYINSGGRGASIRHIIDQIPTLLPKLCPCMLMSPISVAQFIDLNQEKFDIVVFDEASQMPTSEAVGAIARGKALIVVGDPKQMPPTSFFTTTAVDESEADIDDMESILDDCITLSLPEHYLTWHYRSRHESLIAFSNSQYYEGKLYTFPSVDDRASKVRFIPIDGTYDMGKTRCNKAEAEAIVKEVLRRLSDPILSQRSIGIVSFSKVQQDLIEDLLVDELGKQPQLEQRAYNCEEPIFVKNLENVQGDERDVILFSVGYGPDKQGRVSMNFGPLNNAGGERRLNVAVSRARYEMMVFSTMQPEQIDLNRSRARGVEGLKRFLEFAKNGRIPILSSQIKEETDTTIIDSIAQTIRAHGYEVDTQVGRSQFKIDLAVLDPDSSDKYLLGIICDGESYYRTPTQRDREICQPGVLKGLGWELMRVWATDWFLSREQVTDRIIDRLQQILAAREKGADKEKNADTAPVSPTPIAKSAPAANSETKKAGTSPAADSASPQRLAAHIPFEVDPDDILVINAENDKEVPYVKAAINQRHQTASADILLLKRRVIDSDIKNIIKTEQPVTLGTIRKRIMYLYGQQRSTDRLMHILQKSVEFAYIDPMSLADNPVFWMSKADAEGYDTYRKAEERTAEEMPIVEICNAVKLAVSQQISVPIEDLMRQIAKLLGFGRRSPKIDEAIRTAVTRLSLKGILKVEGNTLKMADA